MDFMDFITPWVKFLGARLCRLPPPHTHHTPHILVMAQHQTHVRNSVFITKPSGICPFCTLPVSRMHAADRPRGSAAGSAPPDRPGSRMKAAEEVPEASATDRVFSGHRLAQTDASPSIRNNSPAARFELMLLSLPVPLKRFTRLLE